MRGVGVHWLVKADLVWGFRKMGDPEQGTYWACRWGPNSEQFNKTLALIVVGCCCWPHVRVRIECAGACSCFSLLICLVISIGVISNSNQCVDVGEVDFTVKPRVRTEGQMATSLAFKVWINADP